METHFREKMSSINGNGFPLKDDGFPSQGGGFPLQGNFWQNLKSCFSQKIEKIFEFFFNYMLRDQL